MIARELIKMLDAIIKENPTRADYGIKMRFPPMSLMGNVDKYRHLYKVTRRTMFDRNSWVDTEDHAFVLVDDGECEIYIC